MCSITQGDGSFVIPHNVPLSESLKVNILESYSKNKTQPKVRGATLSPFFFSYTLELNLKAQYSSLLEFSDIIDNLDKIHSHILVHNILLGSPWDLLLFPCMVELTRVCAQPTSLLTLHNLPEAVVYTVVATSTYIWTD